VNRIFQTKCKDAEVIDATATWDVIVAELKSSDEIISTLALRYQMGMTQYEAGRVLGLPVHEIQKRCRQAMSKLRHPCRILRLRNSIMGRPNLYRGTPPPQSANPTSATAQRVAALSRRWWQAAW